MGKNYEVLLTDQLTRVNDTRGLENYYRVQIRTEGGTVLSVDIDEEDFTPKKADPILTAAATNADDIKKLGK
ncbi:hypothetical protein LCGC14_1281030 [marine sediment metagenome]|uniref:Uncharacterized protein n=1 Tax=marine sediment metagenome TaxID=412755 RepID=A0A0F9NY76_9ZZZZ